jgi:beta-galactosidase
MPALHRGLVPLTFWALWAGWLTAPSAAATAFSFSAPQRHISFNEGWRFFRGEAPGAEQPGFRDTSWTPLRLPHDWAIDGPFDPKLDPHTGALPVGGTGWYRKSFTLPESARSYEFSIEFDGAMSNAHVWLNGKDLGGRPYGYIGFALDLTPHLHFGAQENVLAVRLTPEEHASRWYPGAGIYRNVWLNATGKARVAHWGTYVTTPDVSEAKATVVVRTEVEKSAGDRVITLRTSIRDAAGRLVAQSGDETIATRASQTVTTSLAVSRPHRWDVDDPYLYTVESEVQERGRIADRYITPLGIRSIAFSKDKGFVLNGRSLKLHGVCMHHDLGSLGAAVNRRATERQLQILKAAGVNAIRTSHNPPSPELLEFCDRLGLVVMDEAFDMWRIPKVPNGYSKYFAEWSERDVRDMARRDRNHPSVILWSIGNEIPEQGQPDGAKEARRLAGFFHEMDPTRPTTSAFNDWEGAIRNGLAAAVDVPGFNYQPMHYEQILKEHPEWIVFGAETASCVSSRGTYHLPVEKYEKEPSHQLSSYDVVAPPWAYCPDVEFAYQERFPTLLGEFVWTGFDYLGEPTPYFSGRTAGAADWPARSSYFGMVDLAGFPKDRYYLYQSQWLQAPMVHLLPHWNWAGHEGRPIPVMAYSNADEVELLLNGRSLGRKTRSSQTWEMPVGANVSPNLKFTTKYRLIWQVPYETGTLRAVAYRDGKQVAADEVRTAGPPARIRLIPDRSRIAGDGDDLSFITVRIEDRNGVLCPEADNQVQFRITGAGRIEAVDNGNAASVEPFHADRRTAFKGLALVIVRGLNTAGQIRVIATSAGLAQGETEIVARR